MKLNKTLLLLIVIVLEGYAVLSCEMLALRQSISFVGSGTDTVSIIIAAVLMPLAFGYHAGGRFRPGKISIREKLILNIVVAQGILVIGLSYYFMTLFFSGLIEAGIKHRLILTALYSAIFMVTPVYLLGQTIPLVSNYFSKEKLSKITGRMLFFSTLGSFLGAVFSTLILMTTIGVHYTVALLCALLTGLVLLLSRKKLSDIAMASMVLCCFGFLVNSGFIMRSFNIVSDNQYNTVMVYEDADQNRQMLLNNTASSMYNDNGKKHSYIEFVERTVLQDIRKGDKPKDILVIGAGAFTFGLEDQFNNYDFIDIDKTLKNISEKYILQKKLTDNKHFHPQEARAFLAAGDKKYDLIFLDAYNGDYSIPEHLITRDFYLQVKKHLKNEGVVVANFIASPNFQSAFSRHIDTTFRSVFPYVSRSVVKEDFDPWNNNMNYVRNVIYIYRAHPDNDTNVIYTDNKNTIFYDKPHAR